MPESLNELLCTSLLGQIRCLLQLVVLLHQTVVKSGQFALHIVLDISLLISNNLENLGFEFLLALNLQFFQFIEHGVHKWCENTHMLGRHLLTLLNVVFNVAELLLEVV